MDGRYVYLLSVYNDIEAENVLGILETEGIEAKKMEPGVTEFKSTYIGGSENVDIFVPDFHYESAREIIEVEMVRGDF